MVTQSHNHMGHVMQKGPLSPELWSYQKDGCVTTFFWYDNIFKDYLTPLYFMWTTPTISDLSEWHFSADYPTIYK